MSQQAQYILKLKAQVHKTKCNSISFEIFINQHSCSNRVEEIFYHTTCCHFEIRRLAIHHVVLFVKCRNIYKSLYFSSSLSNSGSLGRGALLLTILPALSIMIKRGIPVILNNFIKSALWLLSNKKLKG